MPSPPSKSVATTCLPGVSSFMTICSFLFQPSIRLVCPTLAHLTNEIGSELLFCVYIGDKRVNDLAPHAKGAKGRMPADAHSASQ